VGKAVEKSPLAKGKKSLMVRVLENTARRKEPKEKRNEKTGREVGSWKRNGWF